MTKPVWSVQARWIVPLDRPAIPDGILTMVGERIAEVAPAREARLRSDSDLVDLGDCLVLPGLVNAHTHLDLGGLRRWREALIPPVAFVDWLRGVVAHRRCTDPEDSRAAIRQGIEESLRCGVTLLGDISADGMSVTELDRAPLRAVVFREVLGLTRDRARQTWREAVRWLNAHRGHTRCRLGLSPHAPYSVRRGLFRLTAEACRRGELPWAVHFAETAEELQLLETRSGPLRHFLEELGAWDEAGLCRSREEVLHFAETAVTGLCVHGNYAVGTTPRRLVWCPRTHAFFGHAPHPFRDLMARGSVVALGTDSLASNPDLDLLAEARFVFTHHRDLRAEEVLRMATLHGAAVLGWQEDLGSLTPGKLADWIAVAIPAQDRSAADADPCRALLEHPWKVSHVCIGGQAVLGAGKASDGGSKGQ